MAAVVAPSAAISRRARRSPSPSSRSPTSTRAASLPRSVRPGSARGLAGRRAVEVAAASDCGSAAADRVILAVGYAKTRHGRVLYRFPTPQGPMAPPCSSPRSAEARREVTVVSSLAPDELEDSRLTSPGPRLLKDLLRYAAQGPATPASCPTADADTAAGAEREPGGRAGPVWLSVRVRCSVSSPTGSASKRLSVEDGPAGVDLVVRDTDAPVRHGWRCLVTGRHTRRSAAYGTADRLRPRH